MQRWKSELSDGIDDRSRGTRLGAIAKNANVYRFDKVYFKLAYDCIMDEVAAGYRQIEQGKIASLLELLGKIVEKKACGWDDFCKFIKQVEVIESGSGEDGTEE